MPSPATPVFLASLPSLLWRRLRWGLPFVAALLPIVLLSVYSFQIAARSMQDLVVAGNVSAANNLSQLVTQDLTQTVRLAHAIASGSGTIDAMANRDDITMSIRERTIVLAYPQIERVFVTDPKGTLWSDYPRAPGVFGKSMATAPWFQGVSADWKPYVSGVYLSPMKGEPQVLAIAMPVRDGAEVTGVLVFEYRTEQFGKWVSNLRLGRGGLLYLLDHTGIVAAHPSLPKGERLSPVYAAVPYVATARKGAVVTGDYVDPLLHEEMIATFQPLAVGGNHWVVVAEQPKADAFAMLDQVKWNLTVAGTILTLFTLATVVALGVISAHNERLNRQLASKNQTLQDITSFVSHQLRAPVTAMRWTIESMIDGDYGVITPKLKEALETLSGVAIQNGNLINDILNVSRIDRGVIEVACAAVPLKEVAERALRDYRVALEKAGLSLTLVGADLPITVLADKEKMAEAVTNSLSNAIKHTKKGGLTLTLRADAKTGYIDVTDTGEGMPKEIQDNLFSRTGVHGANTDSSQSTGMGLYIARNFMQMQKGDITVRSTPGAGTTFTYSVPLAGPAVSA